MIDVIEFSTKLFDECENYIEKYFEDNSTIDKEHHTDHPIYNNINYYGMVSLNNNEPYSYITSKFSRRALVCLVLSDDCTEEELHEEFKTSDSTYILRTKKYITTSCGIHSHHDIKDDSYCFNLMTLMSIEEIEIVKFMCSPRFDKYKYMYFVPKDLIYTIGCNFFS